MVLLTGRACAIIQPVKIDVQKALNRIAAQHKEYSARGYDFMYEVIDAQVMQDSPEPNRDITITLYFDTLIRKMLNRFGPMAYTVFRHWGITSVRDIARVLQYLVDGGLVKLSPGENAKDILRLPELKIALEAPYKTGKETIQSDNTP